MDFCPWVVWMSVFAARPRDIVWEKEREKAIPAGLSDGAKQRGSIKREVGWLPSLIIRPPERPFLSLFLSLSSASFSLCRRCHLVRSPNGPLGFVRSYRGKERKRKRIVFMQPRDGHCEEEEGRNWRSSFFSFLSREREKERERDTLGNQDFLLLL